MADANPNQRIPAHTVARTIVLQQLPGVGPPEQIRMIRPGAFPVPYTITITTGGSSVENKGDFDGTIRFEAPPGAKVVLEIFDSKFDIELREDVQPDPKKLSWYAERLHMLGYLTTDELDGSDIDLPDPEEDVDAQFAKFREDNLTNPFLRALCAFQADQNLRPDENVLGESDAMVNTRLQLDLLSGT